MLQNESYLKQQINSTLSSLGFPALDYQFERPKQVEHGDISVNIAMLLTRELKRNPREIASEITGSLQLDPTIIEKMEIAGPGFINFFLAKRNLQGAAATILEQGAAYGRSTLGGGLAALVEFVSANPTGPLTVGHGRQAAIGDTVANLLEWNGYNVKREYYFNNAGRQMRVLGNSVRLRCLQLLGDQNVEFPDDHYQGEYIKAIAQGLLDEHGEQIRSIEEESDIFKNAAESAIFADIRETLAQLGIRFDTYFNESDLYSNGEIDALIKFFRDNDFAYDKDGATWFRSTKFGLEDDRVIVKSSGEPTYRLPDMAYHKNKFERGFDLMIDVFGADHIATYPDVMAGLQALGLDHEKVRVLIHQFVTLFEGSEKVKMSTRKANYVTVDELVGEVGSDAARWFFLMRGMQSHLNFDISLAKSQSEENPVYYNQYAHARICSILRKAEAENIAYSNNPDFSLISDAAEFALIKILMEFPRIVQKSIRDFESNQLLQYLSDVSTAFHRFYTDCRVIDETNPKITQMRLGMCLATRTVLANGFKIAGVSAPEKM